MKETVSAYNGEKKQSAGSVGYFCIQWDFFCGSSPSLSEISKHTHELHHVQLAILCKQRFGYSWNEKIPYAPRQVV
jgi:hypothetical protein